MSVTAVQDGDRLTFTATTDHSAGDLACYNGFYGHVQDDIVAGELGMLILNKVWKFPRVPSTLPQGALVAAPATELATSLPIGLYAEATALGGASGATAGWNVFGRVWETGNASMAAIQLLNPRR